MVFSGRAVDDYHGDSHGVWAVIGRLREFRMVNEIGEGERVLGCW